MAVALMLPAVILVVAAYIRGRIYTVIKHPMLSGVKLWAAAHLIANGDLGGILLFALFPGLAGFDPVSPKHPPHPAPPPTPARRPTNDPIPIARWSRSSLSL